MLEKFENALGSYCLHDMLSAVLECIEAPRDAIEAALDIPGLGLTYASKLLRFLEPRRYGALDSRIRHSLGQLERSPVPKIYDGNKTSMAGGYCRFVEYLECLRSEMLARSLVLPTDHGDQLPWRAADIEMALFQWSGSLP